LQRPGKVIISFGLKNGKSVGAIVETENDRLRSSIEALAILLRLAEQLRRTNAAKWEITEAQWQAAVQEAATSTVPNPNDSAYVSEALRAARSACRRLGNSGDARFGSARGPESVFTTTWAEFKTA
jgi:hypothetical protein